MRKRPKRRIVEIDEVQEPFCGIVRKNTVSLLDAHPEIAAEWLYAKNAGWGPDEISRGSKVRAWWECRICHREYKAVITERTGHGTACPYCASHKVCNDNALTVFHPEIAKEWHPVKNKKLKVEEITRASAKHAWWLCSKCNHEWNCVIASRTNFDTGCPACYKARLEYARLHPSTYVTPQIVLDSESEPSQWYSKPSSESFISVYQYSKSIARQWHPTKNGNITANQISKSSSALAWWKCSKAPDHEWQAVIDSRTRIRKANCPFCTNLKVAASNSLSAKAPTLAKEWHRTKNGKLKPDEVVAGGHQKVWWCCLKDKSHEWEVSIKSRMEGRGCPYCAHKRVSKDNCLNKDFPYIAAQLHPSKNGEMNGDNISFSSNKRVWWLCSKGPDHEWQASPSSRTGTGTGCPCCSGHKRSITNCLATLKPDTAKLWHPAKNKGLTPAMFSPYSNETVWWLCPAGHSWQQGIYSRAKSTIDCSACAGKTLPGRKD
jgi:hypothetical protein